MTTFLGLFIWLIVPMALSMVLLRDARRLLLKMRHNKILYAFCEARDAIAVKALRGEISQDSEIFGYFYGINAGIIHSHQELGSCFLELIRQVQLRVASRSGPYQKSRLGSEIELADDEVKEIVMLYSKAMLTALFTALPWILLDKLTFDVIKGFRILLWMPTTRGSKRDAAQFGLTLASACAA